MRRTSVQTLLLSSAIAAGVCGAVSCTDSDYDLGEVDMTLGIGSGELSIPASSSDTIRLKEVLKFKDSEVVDTVDGGDYVFSKDGDPVSPARPFVSRVTVSQRDRKSFDFGIDLTPYIAAKPHGRRTLPIHFEQEAVVNTFDFDGSLPDGVEDLKWADVSSQMTLRVEFPAVIAHFVGTIASMSIELPDYIDFTASSSVPGVTKAGNRLTLTGVSTAQPLTLTLSVSRINFGKAATSLGSLAITPEREVQLDGKVSMAVTINEINLAPTTFNPADCKITSALEMSSDITLTKVNGRFNPDIDLGDMGGANVTGIPDFLTEDGVVIDLANPTILLGISSDLPVRGFVSGKLTATKGGRETSVVTIPEMTVSENAASRICICRDRSLLSGAASYTEVVEVPNLSDLLNPIPDRIDFKGNARADKDNSYDFELGRRYTVQPSYRIEAPLAFGPKAVIVYSDVFDGWNKDITDYDVTDGTYVELTANVENRVPAFLHVEATPLDAAGRDMPDSQVKVEVTGTVAACPQGADKTVTPVTIRLTPAKGALKNLDGLRFKVSGSAKDPDGNSVVSGVTLNARRHSLVARDIKVKLVGTAVADLN